MKRLFQLMLLGLSACSGSAAPPSFLDKTAMMDPEACKKCHPDHHREWSRSMHAYAAEDPVFIAMNARGQRETHGALGTFCVQCHAPLAVRLGLTTDGTNLASLSPAVRGVTCFFCHSVDSIDGSHNAPLHLAEDLVLRGGIADPVANTGHASTYSPLHDREQLDSSKLCGSCHDIVTPAGAALERTFAEWQSSIYSQPAIKLSCGKCHMEGRDGVAADAPNVQLRKVHSHAIPAVDTALHDFPDRELAKSEVQKALDSTLQASVCLEEAPVRRIHVVLDNVGAGHLWPSGATQDRRAFVEVVAYKNGAPIYQSGVVSSTAAVEQLPDPDLWLVRDCMFDQANAPVEMFWQAVHIKSNQLPAPSTNNPADPNYYLTHVNRSFPDPSSPTPELSDLPDRVTLRVRLQPIARSVLSNLVASGDLDPKLVDAMPTWDLAGGAIEWTEQKAKVGFTDRGTMLLCVSNGLSGPVTAAAAARSQKECRP